MYFTENAIMIVELTILTSLGLQKMAVLKVETAHPKLSLLVYSN